nr:ATP-binding protein [uncultured Sphaerochaeta sp.]
MEEFKTSKEDFPQLIERLKKENKTEEKHEPIGFITREMLVDMEIAKFPKRYQEASFEAYRFYGTPEQQERQRKLVHFLEKGKSVVMYGNNGTGKTMLAFASMRDKIVKGMSTKYISLLDLIDEIKETFNTGVSTLRIIEKYIGYDYLVIDEMDKSYGTPTEFINIFRIVNGRYMEEKPIVLITNASKLDVIAIVGRSSYERIVEDGTAVLMDWDSYRKPDNKYKKEE